MESLEPVKDVGVPDVNIDFQKLWSPEPVERRPERTFCEKKETVTVEPFVKDVGPRSKKSR